MYAIPSLLFLLILVQIFPKPNAYILCALLAFMYSPILIKYIRNFTQKEIVNPLILAEESLGIPGIPIILKVLVPKILIQLIPILVFGIGNIILLETTLSFLGLGLPVEEISLGTLMYQARSYGQAWWVVLFPGLCIFWILLSFNQFGEWLKKEISPS
jgi:peptide/nickel transport system permease protein